MGKAVAMKRSRMRVGMVGGGGPSSFFGAPHRRAILMDNSAELTAGALRSNPDEALAFLQLTIRLVPNDAQTLRLLAEAFLAAGDPATAETMAAAHEAAVGKARLDGPDLLRRARILAGLRKLAAAAAAFGDFIQARRG